MGSWKQASLPEMKGGDDNYNSSVRLGGKRIRQTRRATHHDEYG